MGDLFMSDHQSVNPILSLYQRFQRYPFGSRLFSWVFSRKAPYFANIKPLVTQLQPNYCELKFNKRKAVQNHIGTVHVIAICNGMEMAMGGLAEATIPKHLRWIPKGMQVDYTAKSTGKHIRVVAETSPEQWQPGDLPVKVTAYRDDGTVVVQGHILLYVSEKPTKA
ncbi:thioesterase [Idiomarina xiamenensis 10-D-4]|uniref:Thioesterase n=2 Tax=Idiomarina xiamenensis TaxID=1207041 RepID=K2KR17_9GAMM|nr:thioesterase [Idiomarina xiamenensis 10-D-4]